MRTKRLVVRKDEFDEVLSRMLAAKPEPRKKIKTQGRKGSKAPILSNRELLVGQHFSTSQVLQGRIKHLKLHPRDD